MTMTTKTIYLDTEFSEGFFKPINWLPSWLPGNKPQWSIELISIGLVDDYGTEYYAINKDYKRSRCNEWVKANVLTKLPSRELMDDRFKYDPMSSWPEGTVPNPVYKTIDEIKKDILKFVFKYDSTAITMGINDYEYMRSRFFKGTELVFKAWYADYDWVLFCTIFGTMMDLPDGFPMYCFDLKQEFDRKMKDLWWVISFKNGDSHLKYGAGDNKIDKVLTSKKEMIDLLRNNTDYPKQDDDVEHNALSDAQWNKDLDDYMRKL